MREPAQIDLDRLNYRQMLEKVGEQAARTYLSRLLTRFQGNVTKAAAAAEVERESLHRLLRRFGLSSADFRPRRAGEPEASDPTDGEA